MGCHLVARGNGKFFVVGRRLDQANTFVEVFGGKLFVQYGSVHDILFGILIWMKMVGYSVGM